MSFVRSIPDRPTEVGAYSLPGGNRDIGAAKGQRVIQVVANPCELARAPRMAVSAEYNDAIYLIPRAQRCTSGPDFLEQILRGIGFQLSGTM